MSDWFDAYLLYLYMAGTEHAIIFTILIPIVMTMMVVGVFRFGARVLLDFAEPNAYGKAPWWSVESIFSFGFRGLAWLVILSCVVFVGFHIVVYLAFMNMGSQDLLPAVAVTSFLA